MSNAITDVGSAPPVSQTPQVTVPKHKGKAHGAAPQPKSDTVNISAKGKQAVQQPVPYSPTEEAQETQAEKTVETQAGKK